MPSNIRHPMKPILIDRDISQNLSTTSGNKFELILFAFVLLGFAALYYWVLQNSALESNLKERYSFGCVMFTFLFFAYTIIKILRRGNVRPSHPHLYSPLYVYSTHLFNFIFGSIFFSMALSPFFLIGEKTGKLIVGFFLAAILIYITYKFIGYTITYLNSKPFGKAQVIVDPNPVSLGTVIKVEFINKFLFKKVKHIDVFLRNIEEFWQIEDNGVDKEDGSTNRVVRHYNHLHFESYKNIPLQSEQTIMDFELPLDRVSKTDYTTNHPIYWELEISNEETGYYSRFFIEVV